MRAVKARRLRRMIGPPRTRERVRRYKRVIREARRVAFWSPPRLTRRQRKARSRRLLLVRRFGGRP